MPSVHYACCFARIPFAALLLALVCASSHAQQPADASPQGTAASESPDSTDQITAVPNRPTFATTAEAVQSGVFEIEYGLEAADGHQNINGLLKFGATANLELRFLNNPIERDAGIAGRGDSGAGFKYKLFPQKGWQPTISALYTATIPTATAGVGVEGMGHSFGILISKDFGKHHFDVNESIQLVGRGGPSGFDRNYFSALSYSRPLRGKWGITAEVAGFSRANNANPATMTLLGAFTYNVSPRLVLDTGAYVAAYGRLPRTTYFAGVTYSVADLYHRHRTATAAAKP